MAQTPFNDDLVDSVVAHMGNRSHVHVIAPDLSVWTGYKKNNGRILIMDDVGVVRIVVGSPGESYNDIEDSLYSDGDMG